MKVIVAGGRDFDDYDKLCDACDKVLAGQKPVEIVSGTASGADKLGERYAFSRGYSCRQIPALWDTYGKKAGYLRNEVMAEYADSLIAFWDRKSKGTRHMIDIAMRANLKVTIIEYN